MPRPKVSQQHFIKISFSLTPVSIFNVVAHRYVCSSSNSLLLYLTHEQTSKPPGAPKGSASQKMSLFQTTDKQILISFNTFVVDLLETASLFWGINPSFGLLFTSAFIGLPACTQNQLKHYWPIQLRLHTGTGTLLIPKYVPLPTDSTFICRRVYRDHQLCY